MQLHNPFKRKKKLTPEEIEIVKAWDASLTSDILATRITDEPKQWQGGVIKTQQKQFNMDEKRVGGRVVKAMPRQLKHLKELSEKTDD